MNRLRLLLLVFYVITVFGLSMRPHLDSPGPDFANKDKVYHFVEYFGMGALLFAAAGRALNGRRLLTLLLLFAVGATIAACDEIIQSYTPGREKDFADWVADAVGIVTALTLLTFTRLGRWRLVAGRS